ncbi:MAG: S8 family serine peptidase, partial [Thiohalomonadales bacterium]
APDAQWISVKIFNDSGLASLSAVHEGFQWLLDPDGDPTTDDAPDVVNNSWGIAGSVGTCDNEFKNDVEMLKSAEIAVVFSAGNSGPAAATSLSPANYVDTVAVGAVDQYSNVAYFSSRGPSACEDNLFPDVVAPGVNIKTSSRTYGGAIPNSYAYVSGTSFSAPHVAATMALIKSALPSVTVNELTTVVRSSAVDIFPTGPDTEAGYGLLDAQAAYFQLPIDTDGDGVYDGQDNCILMRNINQNDSDGDGYGNFCDADLNGDEVIDFVDYAIFGSHYNTTRADPAYNPAADFDSNGSINFLDYSIFGSMYMKVPGPSARVP